MPAGVMGMVLALVAASAVAEEPGSADGPAAGDAPGPTEAKAAEEHIAPAETLGPVYVRPFRPMHVSAVRLRGRHGPVYFRSPLAEPAASDRDVDRCVPLACGAAVADWMMFTFRALGFPVEMALAPPWQSEPLGR